MVTETLRVPRNASGETTDGLRVSYSRLEGLLANRSPYIAASCVGLPTLQKALSPGESLNYRDTTRSLAWQVTLESVAEDHAVLSVTMLPLKSVEWYELSEEELVKILESYYAKLGRQLKMEFYRGIVIRYLIGEPNTPVYRSLKGEEVREEIVKIVFPNEQLAPWSVEQRPDGCIRIGVVRGVASLAECVVK